MGLKMAEVIVFTIILLSTTAFGLTEDVFKEVKTRELTPESKMYQQWLEPPLPRYKKIYLFNVTNPDSVLDGSKPNVTELGPYVFREHRKKINVTFNSEDSTVSYNQIKWYTFDPDHSNGSLDDNITALNVPFTRMAIQTEGKLSLMQRTMLPNIIRMYHVKPFVQKTVGQMLFQGYRDEFMVFLATQRGEEILPNGTFGFLYRQNYTSDPLNYTVYTGVGDHSKFLQISKLNNSDHLPYSDDEKCNKIAGSDGCLFKPEITTDDTLHLLTTDMCRTLPLKYEKEEEFHDVKLYRFIPPESALASKEDEADNACFCPKNGDCLKSGVVSNENCQPISPRILSYPHFYQADDTYYNAVNGLKRDKEHHETHYDIEPTHGATLHSHRRIQVNIAVKPVDHIKDYKKFPELVFPLYWIDEATKWPQEAVENFKNELL